MPEHLRLGEIAQRHVGHDPAAHLAGPLADRLATGALRQHVRACGQYHERAHHSHQCATCPPPWHMPAAPDLSSSETLERSRQLALTHDHHDGLRCGLTTVEPDSFPDTGLRQAQVVVSGIATGDITAETYYVS